jgi:predicted RNA-binding Zn-ribbon protein involved in translation (DUF1610 family)
MRLALAAGMSDADTTNAKGANGGAATTDANCPVVNCPNCGKGTPAASNRSDNIVSYRCDVCGHQWTSEPAAADDTKARASRDAASELPPIAAIDAPGG